MFVFEFYPVYIRSRLRIDLNVGFVCSKFDGFVPERREYTVKDIMGGAEKRKKVA